MQFTLRQLKSQAICLPEASRVKAFNDEDYDRVTTRRTRSPVPEAETPAPQTNPSEPSVTPADTTAPTAPTDAPAPVEVPTGATAPPAAAEVTAKTATPSAPVDTPARQAVPPRPVIDTESRRQAAKPEAPAQTPPKTSASPARPAGDGKPVPSRPEPARRESFGERIGKSFRSKVGRKPAAARSSVGGKQASSVPARESIFDLRQRFSRLESAIALSGFVIIVATLTYAWYSWDNEYALAGDADTIYNLGLTGGIMMLVILLYALRKRIPAMQRLGNITAWYYIHFVLGIAAPILIVLHTSFELRSVNATVAFIAMLLVVASGFLGRYIYTRASYGLNYLEKALTSLREMDAGGGIFNIKSPILETLDKSIHADSEKLLQSPVTARQALLTICMARPKAGLLQRNSRGKVRDAMARVASAEAWPPAQARLRLQEQYRRLGEYADLVGNISLYQGFERLAAGWRLLHVPILYLLALSVAAHVFAVHMY